MPPGGITVELQEGIYELPQTFELTAEDSGTDAAPILYRARPGEEVRLVGGREVQSFQTVTDPDILALLEESSRGQVLQADLKAQGVRDWGEAATTGNRLELFFQGKPMPLARWPNEGFVQIGEVPDGSEGKRTT